LRGLKLGETFARNGSYLHENYFAILGGDGVPTGEVKEAIEKKFGSMNDFLEYFSQCGMAARGWAILAWDMNEQRLMQYNCDAQNHGGVWGCIPIIAMVDTNVNPDLVQYPIPANDDAIRSVEMISDLIAQTIIQSRKVS